MCYFGTLLQNGSTIVLWFLNIKHVKLNMKYLLLEQVEQGSMWIRQRVAGDGRATFLKTDNVARYVPGILLLSDM